MLKTASLTIVIGAIAALFALPASALPLAPLAQPADAANILTLVADGCGPGNVRFEGECYRRAEEGDVRSRKRSRSRSDDDDEDHPRRHSRNRDDDRDRAGRGDDECPKGFRFSNSRQKCVRKTDPTIKAINKLLFGNGNNRHQGNNNQQQGNSQGNGRHQGGGQNSGACKSEPGCPCVNGKQVCH